MEITNEIFDLFGNPKKKEITNNLKKLGIFEDKRIQVTINKDNTVDIKGDVMIVPKNIEESPVTFNKINGNFTWHYGKLKSLKGFPKEVYGNLSIVNNNITTLEGSPVEKVTGTFNCSNNKLKNLKGSPKECGEFIAINCGLESLEGSPETITNSFIVSNNELTSLEGGPKKVGKGYDCTSNKLKSLEGIPIGCKVYSKDNPIEEKKEDTEQQLELPLEDIKSDWKEGDKILYLKQGSMFNNMIGIIRTVDPPNDKESETTYSIYFHKLDNPSLTKDGGISGGKARYLRKYVEEFKVGDYVQYNNPNSKYKGFKGKIDSIDETTDPHQYKIRFEFNDNPGIEDVVSQANKNKTFVNVGKIRGDDLVKVSEKGSLASIADQLDDDIPTPPEPKKVERFGYGQRIVYLDPGGQYDECKGRVTYAIERDGKQIIDVEIYDKLGVRQSIMNVDPKKLEKDDSFSPPTIPPVTRWNQPAVNKKKLKYKKGDKVVYIAKKEGDKNKDLHMCKGEIAFLNEYADPSYDVKFRKQLNVPQEKTIYLVKEEQLIPLMEEFKVGEKVVYDNQYDEFNGKEGIVTKVNKETLNVTFNNGDKTMTVTGISPSDIVKFIKPIGSEVHLDDDVIYTKPDSVHYGCKGIVTEYDIDKDKPFQVEILTKDKRKIKVRTTDEMLEFVPPPRIYKKGDTIRYINSESPFDGAIGKVENVSQTGKVHRYDLVLKAEKGEVHVTTGYENIILLEEAADTSIKFGQKVRYTNPNSKFNGKEGEYQGERTKDGKKQYSVKFDEGNVWKTIWFDEGEGTIEATGEPPKPATTTTYATTTYVAPKKKKKKEAEEPRKPVLVYNRRNVAKKAYKKPGTDEPKPQPESQPESQPEKNSDGISEGDTVIITNSVSTENIGKEGIVHKVPVGNEERYDILMNDTYHIWLTKNQFKKKDDDEIKIGGTYVNNSDPNRKITITNKFDNGTYSYKVGHMTGCEHKNQILKNYTLEK